MLYILAFAGGVVVEIIAAHLVGRYKIKAIVEKDVAYLEAKAAALKKVI